MSSQPNQSKKTNKYLYEIKTIIKNAQEKGFHKKIIGSCEIFIESKTQKGQPSFRIGLYNTKQSLLCPKEYVKSPEEGLYCGYRMLIEHLLSNNAFINFDYNTIRNG